MPLRAVIDGSDVIAPLVADDEWLALRERVRQKTAAVALPCCEAGAFLRASKLGTKHFVHRRAAGCAGSGETYQHLWAKAEVVHACVEAGWNAATEVAGDGWRADVLASKGTARVAFEVQWSAQADEDAVARQTRYRDAGIRGCWLFRGDPPMPARRELPMFAVRPDDEQIVIIKHAGRTHPLRQFVSTLLAGKVRFSDRAIARLRVSFVEMDCWRCHRRAHVYYAQQLSRCGHEIGFALASEPRDTGIDPLEPEVIAVVRNWLASAGRGSGVALGAIKNRYSRTVESSYLSFGCPHCDALFGDWFVREAVLDAAIDDYACARFEVEHPMLGRLTCRATGACHPVAARTAPTDARCSSRRPEEWIVRATESDSAKEQHRDEPVAGVGSGASATFPWALVPAQERADPVHFRRFPARVLNLRAP